MPRRNYVKRILFLGRGWDEWDRRNEPAAKQQPAAKRSKTRRFGTALSFCALFFAGLALSAGAGNGVRALLDNGPSQQAGAGATGATGPTGATGASGAVDAQQADGHLTVLDHDPRLGLKLAHGCVDHDVGTARVEVVGEPHLVPGLGRELAQLLRQATFSLDRNGLATSGLGQRRVVIAVAL